MKPFFGNLTHSEIVDRIEEGMISLGNYKLSVVQAEEVTYASLAVMFELELEILKGQHKGRRLYVSENLVRKNGRANLTGNQFYSTLFEVAGITTAESLDKVCNVPIRAEVLLDLRSRDHPRNKLRNLEQIIIPADPLGIFFGRPTEMIIPKDDDDEMSSTEPGEDIHLHLPDGK